MIDHDRLFKELLTTFFVEFVELFLPDAFELLEAGSVTFLDKEVFTDVTSGQKREVDLVARVRFQGREAFFLIHIESQSDVRAWSPERMFIYFARLYEKYRLPVFPVVVFTFDSPRFPQPDFHRVGFPEWRVLDFNFRVIQLNRLNWRDYLKRENPAATALMAKMRMSRQERQRVKYECLRLMATLKIDPARMRLIAGFVDVYLRLSAEEEQWVRRQLQKLDPAARRKLMQITTSWEEKGLQKGLQKGLKQGRQEGRKTGKREGKAELLLRMLARRFGRLSKTLRGRITGLSPELLDRLGEAIFDLRDQKALAGWLDEQEEK